MLLESLVKATVELQGFRVVTVTGDAGGLVAQLAPDLRFLPRCGQCRTRGSYRDTRPARRFRHVPLGDCNRSATSRRRSMKSVTMSRLRWPNSRHSLSDVPGTVHNQESSSMAQTIRDLPEFVDDVRLVVRVTDPIRALKGGPGGGGKPKNNDGVSHTAIQTPPIKMGTSGGWRHALSNGFCCGGTLGALIQVGENKRILSAYHVFEADIEPGGNGITAQTDDPIIQPGLIDVACNAGDAQDVATLVKTSSLPGSNVDASSATVKFGMVDLSGAILEVGPPHIQTIPADLDLLGLDVKKSGRTTGLTRNTVQGINGTFSITYSDECAGGTAFTVTFTDQIVVGNRKPTFIAGGDSGSVMLEDVDINPRAVGLLYAGSRFIAIANPIGDVLSFLGATMVGVGGP